MKNAMRLRPKTAEDAALSNLPTGATLPPPAIDRVDTVSHISFKDLAMAKQLVASVEVRIPWYIIDPQGVNIIKQRQREAAQRNVEAIRHRDGFQARVQAVREVTRDNSTRSESPPPSPGQERLVPSRSSLFAKVTLFPFWDVVTTLALIFTVTVTPFEGTTTAALVTVTVTTRFFT